MLILLQLRKRVIKCLEQLLVSMIDRNAVQPIYEKFSALSKKELEHVFNNSFKKILGFFEGNYGEDFLGLGLCFVLIGLLSKEKGKIQFKDEYDFIFSSLDNNIRYSTCSMLAKNALDEKYYNFAIDVVRHNDNIRTSCLNLMLSYMAYFERFDDRYDNEFRSIISE